MNNKFKDTDRKNCTYCFFNDTIKHEEMWSKIRDLIRLITNSSDDFDENV